MNASLSGGEWGDIVTPEVAAVLEAAGFTKAEPIYNAVPQFGLVDAKHAIFDAGWLKPEVLPFVLDENWLVAMIPSTAGQIWVREDPADDSLVVAPLSWLVFFGSVFWGPFERETATVDYRAVILGLDEESDNPPIGYVQFRSGPLRVMGDHMHFRYSLSPPGTPMAARPAGD